MNQLRPSSVTPVIRAAAAATALAALAALAAIAGCDTVPPANPRLEEARSDYRAAQDNPQVRDLAGGELSQAGDALKRADAAAARRDSAATVDHLAYLAKQRAAIAQATAQQKYAELAVTNANLARDRVRLAARTSEADAAQRSAEAAQIQSAESQIESVEAQRRAVLAQRQAAASQQQADASQQQADAALRQNDAMQKMADATQARNAQLEDQLRDLNAKRTERGLVVTIGDVLFDTNQAELKSASARSVEKLDDFLKQYPQRTARVEGFTDSTGSTGLNQELSDRRAASVRAAIVALGVDRDRIAVRGYGADFPVASNASLDGRQLNRRVEVILSNDSGVIAPR
jgi:outer membrane protein OmpA-like peptidoglycan-associated protein